MPEPDKCDLTVAAEFDFLINNLGVSSKSARQVIEARTIIIRRLRGQAIEHFGKRKLIADQEGRKWDDFTKSENILTPYEFFGVNGSEGESQARSIRNLFSEHGMSADIIMATYFRQYDEAQKYGRASSDIEFMTLGQKNTLNFALAQEMQAINTIANMPLIFQGNPVRTFLGNIFRFVTRWFK